MADAQEPSMEDILASIRRILSEEETQEQAAAAAPAAAPPAAAAPAPAAKAQEWGAGAKPDGAGGQGKEWAGGTKTEAPGAQAKEWSDKPAEAPGGKKESWQDKPPEAPSGKQESWQDKPAEAASGKQEEWLDKPAEAAGPAKAWDQDDGVLVLTPDMIVEEELELGDGGSSALAQLKRAIAQRAHGMASDRNLALGNGGITIEQLVREILDDLLRDWLNQHLPPMVDRIARHEIQKLVNQD